MKKRMAIGLCFVMAVSLFLMPAGAFAAESGVISGENCSAEAGETILYTVDISGNPGLAGFMVYVACDTSVFDIGQTQATLGSFSDSGSIFTNPESEDGWRVLWFNAQNVSGNGTLFTLEISVADDAASGTYPVKITLSPENTVNAAGELVDFSCIDGSIVVSGGTDTPIDEDEKPQPSQEPEEPDTQDPEQPDDDNQTDPEDEPVTDIERPAFADVPATHWAFEYVSELSSRGIVDGVGDNMFNPNGQVTRAQFVKMLAGVLGAQTSSRISSFVDVPADEWYAEYVVWAYANGLTDGVDAEHFAPNAIVTREQICTLIVRAAGKYGMELVPVEPEINFTDSSSISAYAVESVRVMQGAGIISGYEDGSFKPHNGATRAEAAKLLCGLIDLE